MNPTLELINARCSTRVYAPEPITAEEKQAILNAAFRAPTAGNLTLYSILQIEDQTIKDRLAETCDEQPFIAKAPWVLVFLADFQRWMDVFRASDVERLEGVAHRRVPEAGDLLFGCCDALIAAQNAAVAAESLGIGTCYVGDVLENGEILADLLGLPNHVCPVTLLCLGRPVAERPPTTHFTKHVVHRDRYQRLAKPQIAEMVRELEQTFAPHGLKPGFANYGQQVYANKFVAPYVVELNRSVAWWLERWSTPES